MKRKISLLIAGLGLCASVMLMLPKQADSQTVVSNTCSFNGVNACPKGCMGCICGPLVITDCPEF